MAQQLTARQEAFCRAFVGGAGSAAEAARQAGYAPNTARAQASRLLHTPAVMARVDALRADHARAQAAFSARLMAEVEAVRARAVERGDDRMVLRSVETQMRLARQFGLPELPADSFDVACEGADTDDTPVESDAGETPEAAADADTAAADDAVLTQADAVARETPAVRARVNGTESGQVGKLTGPKATRVDACERAGAAPAPTGAPARPDPDILDRPPGHSPYAAERLAPADG